MKNKLCSVFCVLAATTLLFSGCGAKQTESLPAEPETTAEPAESTETEQAPQEEQVTEEKPHTAATYDDPNGWSLQYYEDCFEVNQQDNVVSFVYTGESGGTNMLTVTYDTSTGDPEAVADRLVGEWGDKAVKSEGTFPSDENVPIFRASLPVEEGGSGLYMEAIIRSYMEGCLVFELTGHNSGDDEVDMAVSDMMAMLIDSVTFSNDGSSAEVSEALNIEGCDTFTQIVDRLEDGKGYTNVKIGSEDALLVSGGTYDNGDGTMAAIDAEIFVYVDGVPTSAGTVACGGTAYPLAVKDDMLFVGSGHEIRKYILSGADLTAFEGAIEEFDTDGNASYSYFTDKNGDETGLSQDECKAKFDDLFAEYEKATVLNFDTVGGSVAGAGSLPAYEYPGPELFYSVLYKYLTDELTGNYPEAEVSIPCVSIVETDESDKNDIRVYGDFEIYTYNLNGDVLECAAGGSYPGVIHVKSTDEGYEVTGMETVEDGSGFDDSAKKIFGGNYDAFMKIYGDSDAREKTRAQIIANYVAANSLSVKSYKDSGWDPVSLPEENIDSFYSVLD